MDFIGNSHRPSNKLFWVSHGRSNDLSIMGKGNVIKSDSEVKLSIQRTNKNNFYWIENSASLGTLLRGVI